MEGYRAKMRAELLEIMLELERQGKNAAQVEAYLKENQESINTILANRIVEKEYKAFCDDLEAKLTFYKNDDQMYLNDLHQRFFQPFRLALITYIHAAKIVNAQCTQYPDNKPSSRNSYTVAAALTTRGLQRYFEILTLLRNALPEGATILLRSLYEIVVVSRFILDKGEVAASAYIEEFNSSNQWDWALKANVDKGNKKHVSFKDLEKFTEYGNHYEAGEMYSFASRVNHAYSSSSFNRVAFSPTEGVPIGRVAKGIAETAINATVLFSHLISDFLNVADNEDSAVDNLLFQKITLETVKAFDSFTETPVVGSE